MNEGKYVFAQVMEHLPLSTFHRCVGRYSGEHKVKRFSCLDQHLRIEAFFGESENAVKTQIWIAVSVYVLVAIIRKRLGLTASLYEILQILSLTMFERMPINSMLSRDPIPEPDATLDNQLKLFD